MCATTTVTLNLGGIKEGAESRSFSLGTPFFAALDDAEIKTGEVGVKVDVATQDGVRFEIAAAITGYVEVACDVCLSPMRQPVSAQLSLLAVIGEAPSGDDDTVTVSPKSGVLDLSWPIYEQIALAVPIRHVHEEGQCSPEMLRILGKLAPKRGGDGGPTATDPRWNALKNLKTN